MSARRAKAETAESATAYRWGKAGRSPAMDRGIPNLLWVRRRLPGSAGVPDTVGGFGSHSVLARLPGWGSLPNVGGLGCPACGILPHSGRPAEADYEFTSTIVPARMVWRAGTSALPRAGWRKNLT